MRLGVAEVADKRNGRGFIFVSGSAERGANQPRWFNWQPLVGENQLLAALFQEPPAPALALAAKRMAAIVTVEGPSCHVATASLLHLGFQKVDFAGDQGNCVGSLFGIFAIFTRVGPIWNRSNFDGIGRVGVAAQKK